ncbi:uncharacterized protein LOC120075946 [Benincasa hispida]|uniref:uncharacterized protein LOC120075946 n=1 Tax=Benincasa hispida TaxID=102211 RepID=UPI001901B3CF|nr:uncharacterized protein LOC120075946 [Benincasa hispida]
MDYVSKWMEANTTIIDDAKMVAGFLKTYILCRFGFPKAIISNQGSHFCNRVIAYLLMKYGVQHHIATPYHPQTNEQTGVSNREVKIILKKMVNLGRKVGAFDLTMLYGLTIVKKCNWDLEVAGDARLLQLQELEELMLESFDNSLIYKQRAEDFHDKMIAPKEFQVEQKVLLYNSRLKFMPEKLQSKWLGSFGVSHVYPYGAVDIINLETRKVLKVNGHKLKVFHDGESLDCFDIAYRLDSLVHI